MSGGRRGTGRWPALCRGALALALGALGWALTHLLLDTSVLGLVGNHRLAHLSAFAMASGCLAAGTLASVFSLAGRLPRSMTARRRGLLSPLGFVLTALASSFSAGHHELPGLLLVALGATAQAAVGLATSMVWQSCVLAWCRLPCGRQALPVVTSGAVAVLSGAADRLRPKLWVNISPRRGPPVGLGY
ncbi:MAG TPA: hypothetical protein VGM60_24305 [Pseudonocardia sp.]|jgi:hypothetical protein|uniref:hypothetical protein n=1 Tax=Pseudonocardia sp. TaxID=60912 RepID=UPI002F42EEB5